VLFVAFGFGIGMGNASQIVAPGSASVGALLLAILPIMFAYSGWNAGAYLAEEIRDPGRNLPIALGIGTVAVIAIYLALNALFLYALPPAELASPPGELMDTVADRLFGNVTGGLLALFSIVSMAASVSAMMIAGPRVYFAMARDGMFLPAAGVVHPRSHVPVHAIVAQALWSGVLVLSGTLSQLVSYTGFAIVLFSAIAVAAVFVLRHRRPDDERPFRAWGYPWAPATFVVMSVLVLGNEIWRTPQTSLAGLAVISAGIPVYMWMRRTK
jgi:APA family basic amino acid/polyamine antiporter